MPADTCRHLMILPKTTLCYLIGALVVTAKAFVEAQHVPPFAAHEVLRQ